MPESEIAALISRHKPIRTFALTASPFNWLDATIFYVDITKKSYGNGFKQSYKDKGFSFKVSPFRFANHQIAIGMNDLAGTGLFNSEYIVASNRVNRLEYSIGLGWGNFTDGVKANNPFISLDDSFKSRSRSFRLRGGAFDLNNYFSGNEVSLFGGARYELSANQNISIEYDPTNIVNPNQIVYPSPKTKFSIAYEQKFKNFLVQSSFIRGSSFGINFIYNENFSNFKHADFSNLRKATSYRDLQYLLEERGIGLKEILESQKKILIKARQNNYPNQVNSNKLIHTLSSNISQNKEEIIIAQYIHGMPVLESSFPSDSSASLRGEKYIEIDEEDYKTEYVVNDIYPQFNNSVSPKLRNFIASREGLYHGGIFLEDNLEIVFSESFFLLGNFKYSLFDNFDNLTIPPVDTYPEQVRSDIKKYYNNFDNGITIGRLEIDYFTGINENHFFRFSAGLLEEMFGGLGFDYLFHPEGSLISFGLEHYFVKKRDYKMRFGFLNYQNNLSRANIYIQEPKTDIGIHISYGEYLAGDKGYTLRIAREFFNGVEMSVFYSRTNVPPELFGEGSFDKGILLKLPLPTFGKKRSLSSFEWRPLIKDPASQIIKAIDISNEIRRYRKY